MTDEQDRTAPLPLTSLQRARLDFARRDLEAARVEDLAQLPPEDAILLIEKLRSRLDDTLRLVYEVLSPSDDPGMN
jgi:hypothetical protein